MTVGSGIYASVKAVLVFIAAMAVLAGSYNQVNNYIDKTSEQYIKEHVADVIKGENAEAIKKLFLASHYKNFGRWVSRHEWLFVQESLGLAPADAQYEWVQTRRSQ